MNHDDLHELHRKIDVANQKIAYIQHFLTWMFFVKFFVFIVLVLLGFSVAYFLQPYIEIIESTWKSITDFANVLPR